MKLSTALTLLTTRSLTSALDPYLQQQPLDGSSININNDDDLDRSLAAKTHPIIKSPHIPTDALSSIPPIGFGTWLLKNEDDMQNTTDSVAYALQSGYRQIDCAAAYRNQKWVGAGIAAGLHTAGLKRKDIWVTSKLWNDHHGTSDPTLVESEFNTTLADLGVGYLDLYLMHWPVGEDPKHGNTSFDYEGTWARMEKLLDTGRVRYIGISNFAPEQLRRLMKGSDIKPYAHQFESHPYLQQGWWVSWHRRLGVKVTAYSPLANMNPTYKDRVRAMPPPLLEDGVMKEIAKDRACTPAQVALAWNMERGAVVIPKSMHERFIEENLGSLNCRLLEQDYPRIEALGKRWLTRMNNPGGGWGVHLFKGLDDSE